MKIVFVRCTCGKLHATGGMRVLSSCSCGVKLWNLITVHN